MSSFLKTISELPPPQSVFPNPIKKPRRGRGGKKLITTVAPEPQPKPVKKAKKRKQKIPAALREQVWIHRMGRVFEGKCQTTWCQNRITVFDFQSGHDIPESKGGPTTLENLYPLCSRCNLSMGDTYTIQEWCKISNLPKGEQAPSIEMTPKMMEDDDGDVPPCSVVDSYEGAEKWDQWKQKKYKGKQKAKRTTLLYHSDHWRSKLYRFFHCFTKKI